ncbi:MAG: nucleoside recognition domain-containing protein, partial [Flavobacterium sp.]
WRERLITILITPFVTCSARLPVYTILISLIIPEKYVFGIFNLQGLTLMLLYLLGFGGAILAAWILNKILELKHKSFFVAEMPNYKLPMFKNVAITVIEKTKAFVFGAGKIILALSVVIWFLGSHGPGDDFKNAAEIVKKDAVERQVNPAHWEDMIAAYQLEHSYIGIMGKTIEPVIRPLGYDWKIGVGIVSSFAAREVFVGTLATIYNIGSSAESEDEVTIRQRMAEEINPETGEKVFNFATGASLLLFYAFAMQCISTLAITKKETNSWKWPLIQLVGMSGFAYVVALIAYQFLK